MTNGDRIRAMSDEELAEFLETDTCCKFCILGDYDEKCNWYEKCDERIFQWLKQEVQENDD